MGEESLIAKLCVQRKEKKATAAPNNVTYLKVPLRFFKTSARLVPFRSLCKINR